MTSVAAEKRAATYIGQLTRQSKITAKTLPSATLTSRSGPEKLILEMDKKSEYDGTTVLHNKVAAFFNLTWEKTMSVDEFVVGFHAKFG